MQTRDFQWMRGRQGSIFLASSYTAQADVATFVTSAVEGDVGIVNKATGAIYDALTAIPTGTEVYSILKRDGLITPNAPFTIGGNATFLKVVGAVGVAKVVTVVISCGGTTANCGNCINCVADPIENYRIGIIQTRTHDYVPDEITYQTVANGSETITSVVNRLIAQINDPVNIVNNGGRKRVTASAATVVVGTASVATTITFTITGDTSFPFAVSISGFCVSTQTNTTEANDAVNGYDDVRQYEREGAVQDGDRYMQRAFPPMREVDGSHPTALAARNALYTVFQINITKEFESATYKERDFQSSEQNIYVLNGSTAGAKLGVLFAV